MIRLLAFFDRERTIAEPDFSRWLVPPAALAIHLSIGQAYAFSVFNLPLLRLIGGSDSAPTDWKQARRVHAAIEWDDLLRTNSDDGSLASVTDPNGSSYRYVYDVASRIDSVLIGANAIREKRWYDADDSHVRVAGRSMQVYSRRARVVGQMIGAHLSRIGD